MARAIDADRLADGLKLHRQPTDQKHEADRQWAMGYNAGLDRALHSIAYAPTLTPPNEPLTLEQLLEMNGKPVWTKLLVESTGRKEGWTLVYNDDRHAAVQRWTQFPLWYKDYGKTWLAYAYHPVHIDREKWEPCKKCSGEYQQKIIALVERYHGCITETSNIDVNFCPVCGRPITDEAWDALEKRMRGM